MMRPPVRWLIALLLSLCAHGANATAATLVGHIVSINDGDTVTLLVERQPINIRLAEIDAPERRQAYGNRSRQSIADLCFKQPARVETVNTDRFGRTVGHLFCNGIDAQAYQVSAGMAWVFDRYSSPSSPLYPLQAQAKAARRGLWADANPVPPWQWRRTERGQP